MRDAVRHDGQRVARHEIGAGPRGILDGQVGAVEAGCPDIDADRLRLQRGEGEVGVLQRAPGHRQQQPLLGIHRHGLAPRKPEEARVEQVDAVDDAGGECIGLSGNAGAGVPEAGPVPAPCGNLGDGALPLAQHCKQLRCRIRTGSNRSISDNFNRHEHQTSRLSTPDMTTSKVLSFLNKTELPHLGLFATLAEQYKRLGCHRKSITCCRVYEHRLTKVFPNRSNQGTASRPVESRRVLMQKTVYAGCLFEDDV
nr:hypothetical protein SHINE37_80104 [Rhizobiaceae bacterium]